MNRPRYDAACISTATWVHWEVRNWLATHDPAYLHEMDAAE